MLFERDNEAGGSDLWSVRDDGRFAPLNLTAFSSSRVVDVDADPSGSDPTYLTATDGGVVAFHSISTASPGQPSGPRAIRLSSDDLGAFGREDWQPVGGLIVVKSTIGDRDQLLAVATDGAGTSALTAFTTGRIRWPRNPLTGRNLVANGGDVVFEHVVGDVAHVYVAATRSGGVRRLGSAARSTVALDRFGQPMVSGDSVVIEENTLANDARQFRLFATGGAPAGTPLGMALPPWQQPILRQLRGDHLVLVVDDSLAGRQDLLIAPLHGASGGVTVVTASLTAPGLRIEQVAWNRDDTQLVFVASAPDGAGNVVADLCAVEFPIPGAAPRTIAPGIPSAAVGDIEQLLVLDRHAAFARRSQPDIVRLALVDTPGSEMPIPALPAGDGVRIECGVSEHVPAFGPYAFEDPANRRYGRIVLAATTPTPGALFTNFYSLSDPQGALAVTRLSNNFVVADSLDPTAVLFRQGDRIVYRRDGLYAASVDAADSEVRLTNADAMPVPPRSDWLNPSFLFYHQQSDLYSVPIDRPQAEPASMRRLTQVQAGATVELLFVAWERAVFAIHDHGTSSVFSSEITPERPQVTPVSRGSADRFRAWIRLPRTL